MSRLASSTFIDSISRKQRPRIKSAKKDQNNASSPRKKPSPLINKSFACYNVSSKVFNYSEILNREKNRTMFVGSYTPSHRKMTSMRIVLNSSHKFSNGHPGPKELEESKQVKLKTQLISENLELAQKELSSGSFESAMGYLKKVFREDANNLKAVYLKAQCFIGLKEYKLAIPDLLSIIQDHPGYSKKIYIDIATCFVESKDFTTAARQLTRGLLRFPKFFEGFLSRGTVYNKLQKWDKAVNDFYQVLALNPNEGAGYLGLADSLVGIGDSAAAIKTLDRALKCPNSESSALLKRGKLLFEIQNFTSALEDFCRLIEIEPANVEAHYYKGFCFLSQNNLIDAALALEQVVKYDISKKYTGAAIYNLGAIKIKQRDFYGAHFTFQRAVEIGVEIDEQKTLRSYVDAILCLIRRNFKEGVAALTKIIKKKNELIQEYMGNCLAYRGYAYSSLDMHEKAVKDLMVAKKAQDLDNASLYNLLVSQAVISKDTENSLVLFKQAQELFPKNIEPIEYISCIYFHQAVLAKTPANQSKELLDAAVKMRDSDSDLYFYRGIVLYYNSKTIDAVYDFEKAIEKAEDNIANHFLARGLCSAKLKMFKEAIQDFTIAIQLDEKKSFGYLYRARCFFLIEDFDSAHSDFEKALELNPSDGSTQNQVLDFLLLAGALEEALKICENMYNQSQTVESSIQKVKCYLLKESLDSAIKELNLCNSISRNPKTNFDIELLEIYKLSAEGTVVANKVVALLTHLASYKTDGHICKISHVHWLKGCLFMYLGEILKAKEEFGLIITKKKKKEQIMEKSNAEAIYNLALCFIIENKYKEALELLSEICNYLDQSDRGKVFLLIGMLKYALGQNREAKSVLKEAFNYDPDIVGNFLEEKPDIEILPLDSASALMKNFSAFKLTIGENKPVHLKPSINFPRPPLCNFDFSTEPELLNLFSVQLIKSKPETPWLNRVKGSIQFTDEIQNIESESFSEDCEKTEKVSDVFSSKAVRKIKSVEALVRSPTAQKQADIFDSSLSEIADDLDYQI